MGCDVSLGGYDGDAAEFFDTKFPKARKSHRCYECRGEILPGERYERVTGKWDGELESYHFCDACSEIQREFSDDGRVFGNMWADFKENWHNGASLQACMNRVTSVAAKTRLREQWLKFKGLAQ